MKRIALILAAALALLLPGVAAPASAENRVPQSTTYAHVYRTQLLTTSDFRVACLTMDRNGRYTVEEVNFVFRFKLGKRDAWRNVWVASDGWQFTIDTAGRQNPPWACAPLAARVPVPESWGN